MAIQGLVRFIYTLIIGRVLGPEALGETVALLSAAVYLSLMLPAGLGVAASRFLPLPETGGSAIRQLTLWFWIASIILSVISIPLSYWLVGDVAAALTCAVLVLTYNAYVFRRGALLGENRVLRVTIADFISSLIAITVLVAVLLGGANWGLLLPLSAGYAIFALVAQPSTKPSSVSRSQRIEFARFVAAATIGSLATGGLLPATIIFVRAFDAPLQAGLFAAALSLATPAALLSQALNQIFVPHFARLENAPNEARASLLKLLAATTAMFFLIFVLLIWLSPLILRFLYGNLYIDGAEAMRALLVVVFFISATSAPAAYLVATGWQNRYAVIWVVSFLMGTAAMFILSPSMEMWGAIIGLAIGAISGSIAVTVQSLWVKPRGFSMQN
jgi:O-antigen/teichoic acid export membrane protein